MAGLLTADDTSMATVGHTLVGLSLSGLSRAAGREGKMRYVWPGFMVLMGHFVDIAEWVVVVAAPEYFDEHFVTNSPLLTSLLVAGIGLFLRFVIGLRRPWPYLLMALAVFSHLLLDHRLTRTVFLVAYENDVDLPAFDIYKATLAEVWLLGLFFIVVELGRASFQRACPRYGRAAAGILAAIAIFACISQQAILWIPAYALASLHALVLSRRDLSWRLVWSLLPITPVVALLAVELWAGHLEEEGHALENSKNYAAAAKSYGRALALPTRSRCADASGRLGECELRLEHYAAAEAALRHTIRYSSIPNWYWFKLAMLYANPKAESEKLYHPTKAAKFLQMVIEDRDSSVALRTRARDRLAELEKAGVIAPPTP